MEWKVAEPGLARNKESFLVVLDVRKRNGHFSKVCLDHGKMETEIIIK